MTTYRLKSVIDYDEHVKSHTRDFTGRDWVFNDINTWLDDDEGAPFYLLTAEPGTGKTALAAQLYSISTGLIPADPAFPKLVPGFLSAAHFCSSDFHWRSPRVFSESISLQLASRYEKFAKALVETSGDRQVIINAIINMQNQHGGKANAVNKGR